eukprot:1139250-Pelagomonas_calceolata.AAC.2
MAGWVEQRVQRGEELGQLIADYEPPDLYTNSMVEKDIGFVGEVTKVDPTILKVKGRGPRCLQSLISI